MDYPGSATSISIGENAFAGCTSLTSITIPESVTSIGDEAFQKCENLRKVIIGKSVTSIGNNVFTTSGMVLNVYKDSYAEEYAKENQILYTYIYVSPIDLTTQPKATTVVGGNKMTFKVAANSNIGSTLTYQWQYSKDNGMNWTSSAQKTNTYSIAAKTTWNGWLYRCVITDAEGNTVTSDSAKITVNPIIAITAQPAATTVVEGKTLIIKVLAVSNTGSTLPESCVLG